MNIKRSMIRRELRFAGGIYRMLLPYFTPRTFRFINRALGAVRGVWLGCKTRMEERFLPRAQGGALRLCICRAWEGARSGAAGLLWMHGGGYATGLPEQDFAFIERFAENGGCVVVAPDYRRSLEAPYPAALTDCYDALLWMKAHAKELGIREDQLFVGGDSAGGGLSAALCLYARDRGEAAVAFQISLYPMLDDRASASMRGNDAPVWNEKSNRAAWELYLSGHEGETPAYAAPARAKSLANLPPACIYVGTIDPFYEEAKAYAARLSEAGVPVRFRVFEGCFHGFDALCPASDVTKQARAFLGEAFGYARRHYFAPQPEGKG